jgi:hypothetical protein
MPLPNWFKQPLWMAAACLVFGLTGCGSGYATGTASITPAPAPAAPLPSIWVGAWGDANTNADQSSENNGGTDRSYRFQVIPTIGGTQERVRFSNYYGKGSVTIGAARLSVGTDGSPAIDTAHDVALAFNGQPGITIAAGQVVTSDAVTMTFNYGQVLDISVYLKGSYGPVSRHDSLFMTNYQTSDAAGDKTADSSGASFSSTLGDWLLIKEVDVYGPYQGTFALFGSSTTDGYHSDYSDTATYPTPNSPVPGQHTSRLSDWLAKRLNAAGYKIGVVNLGIPGDTVTVDSTNITGDVQNANDRIGHDLLTLPSLLGAVTYFGSIDIRSSDCKSAPAIESATEQMVATAAAAKVPLILATIPPSAFCTNPAQANFGPTPTPSAPYAGGASPGPENGGEAQRTAFNTWIRTTGKGLAGVAGIADFDAVMLDPAHPNFLQSQYNSGDNYHPNGNGYHIEADTIPLSLLPAPQ